MDKQARQARVGQDRRNRELDLGDELPVGAQGLGSLNDAVLNEEPRNDSHKHKGKKVK